MIELEQNQKNIALLLLYYNVFLLISAINVLWKNLARESWSQFLSKKIAIHIFSRIVQPYAQHLT